MKFLSLMVASALLPAMALAKAPAKAPPPAATQLIKRVTKAARRHDLEALRKVMTANFIYSYGDDETPDAAIAHWTEKPTDLDALIPILDAGCVATKPAQVVCPPAAAGDDFTDRGVAFMRDAKGWHFAWFVGGD
jgi:hypothetical protein